MKKILCFLLTVIFVFAVAYAIIILGMREMPMLGIYNYFENSGAIPFIVLEDHIAVTKVPDTIVICNKELTESSLLGESVFDTKKKLPFLLGSTGNVLVYSCMEKSGGRTYYSVDLNTYERTKLISENSVTNAAGFLGVQNILGIVLDSKNISSYMNAGRYWINSEGVHSAKKTSAYLADCDKSDEYGIYNNMEKFAESETDIFFINFFGELVRFQKATHTFEYVFDKIIDDFYITDEYIYYIYNSEFYRTDFDGKNDIKLCDFAPITVKKCDGNIYARDAKGMLWLVTSNSVVKICAVDSDFWTVSEEKIYYYIPDERKLGYIINGKDVNIKL